MVDVQTLLGAQTTSTPKNFETNKNSSQSTWNIPKSFMNWKKTGSPHSIFINNRLFKKAYDVAEIMNQYFFNKLAVIRANINYRIWTPASCQSVMLHKKCKLHSQFVTKAYIKKLLRGLSTSKCSAIDGLDNFCVKIASDVIDEPLHHIITLSIMQEKFPSQWKLSKVIPLHKKDDISSPENYRPVSILSPLSKILERVMHEQIYRYVTTNKILHENIHGYRRNRSTLTALLKLYERWVSSADEGKISGAVLIDLSAAFDLVSPSILMKKLKIYGFQSSMYEWIESYLTDRFQAVWIDHTMSSYLPCSVGVPQGSILGPLLFMLFVNDLPFILDCGVEIYADDTTLTSANKNSNETSLTLTRNCGKINEWMEANTLKLNAGKTHLLTLGTDIMLDRPEIQLHVSMDRVYLSQSEHNYETLLGCIIQSNLKWTRQKSDLKRRLSNRIAGVYSIRKAIPLKTLKIICQGWCNSILVYCLPSLEDVPKAIWEIYKSYRINWQD